MRTFKRIMYWVGQCTWGFIMTFLGACATAFLLIKGHKAEKFGPNVVIRVGKNWGGVCLGSFILVCEDASADTLIHESGHAIQNLYFGPLFPFIVAIPSALRYHCRVRKNASEMSILMSIVCVVIMLLVSLPMTFLGVHFLSYTMQIIAAAWVLYSAYIWAWLQFKEIRGYCNRKGWDDYDSVWFEGNATKIGEEHYRSMYIIKESINNVQMDVSKNEEGENLEGQ